jgi:hypothetical protein
MRKVCPNERHGGPPLSVCGSTERAEAIAVEKQTPVDRAAGRLMHPAPRRPDGSPRAPISQEILLDVSSVDTMLGHGRMIPRTTGLIPSTEACTQCRRPVFILTIHGASSSGHGRLMTIRPIQSLPGRSVRSGTVGRVTSGYIRRRCPGPFNLRDAPTGALTRSARRRGGYYSRQPAPRGPGAPYIRILPFPKAAESSLISGRLFVSAMSQKDKYTGFGISAGPHAPKWFGHVTSHPPRS